MRFFDTNVLVYTEDPASPAKQAVARTLVREAIAAGQFVISTQVIQEFYDVVTRKRLLSPAHATMLLQSWADNEVVCSSPDLLFRAFTLQQSRNMSMWDALVVQAALESGCATLYSEDLQAGARFGELVVANPFAARAAAAHEPDAPYTAPARRKRAKPA